MPTEPLRAEHFYKFFQCPHWIWYDIYGDAKQKKHVPPLLDMIYKGKMIGAGTTLKNHKKFEEIKPELFRDLDEAFMATLELMKQGKNIYHGVLMSESWVGIPDLLEARPGKSEFGEWEYVVYDAQSSLELRDENKFQLIFYSLILERLQGVRPKEAYAIDPQGNERSFLVDDFVEQFHLTRLQIEKILDGQKPPPFLKSGCKRTPWYSLCVEETRGCNDVSLIYKLSQADQRRLYDIGITTVQDMANADVNDLQTKLEDWSFDKLVRFNNQAKVLISGEPIITRKPEFPEVKHEVYFDIESDPTKDIDYLLGMVVVTVPSVPVPRLSSLLKSSQSSAVPAFQQNSNLGSGKDNVGTGRPAAEVALAFGKQGQWDKGDDQRSAEDNVGTGTYKYFFARNKEEEPEMWKKFLDFLVGLEDFVIYHYAYYERQVFDRLVLRYGAPATLVNKFKENTIDLHLKVVESVVLPLYFYSLKDVAKYFGYKWNAPDAGGAESVVWFSEWSRLRLGVIEDPRFLNSDATSEKKSGLEKKADNILEKILKYNEDDVRATFLIKEWLSQHKPHKKKEKLDFPEE